MNRCDFLRHVGVALALAIAAAASSLVLATLMPFAPITRVLIAAACGTYTLYLLIGSGRRAGVATLTIAWLLSGLLVWLYAPSLTVFAAVHTALIWLVRSLLRYRSILPALVDLGLSTIAVLLGVAALQRTGSVFLATWSFFLLQAIAAGSSRLWRQQATRAAGQNQTFERARLQAEAALSTLRRTS